MNRDEIFAKIRDVLVADFECPPEKVTLEAKLFEDLDLDSIDAVDLIVRLQQMTQLKVTTDDFRSIHTLGDIVDVIVRLIAEQKPAS